MLKIAKPLLFPFLHCVQFVDHDNETVAPRRLNCGNSTTMATKLRQLDDDSDNRSKRRFSFCRSLRSYSAVLNNADATCPECGLDPQTTSHLSDCVANPLVCELVDLWCNSTHAAYTLPRLPSFSHPPSPEFPPSSSSSSYSSSSSSSSSLAAGDVSSILQ